MLVLIACFKTEQWLQMEQSFPHPAGNKKHIPEGRQDPSSHSTLSWLFCHRMCHPKALLVSDLSLMTSSRDVFIIPFSPLKIFITTCNFHF